MTMAIDPSTSEKTRDRILLQLKMRGPHSAAELAELFGVTGMAIRQHLSALQSESLVHAVEERRPIGRPARVWRLSEGAAERFPSGYDDLALDVLESVRISLGDEALEKVLSERTERQISHYLSRMPGADADLAHRVERLVEIRREEGFLPEWSTLDDGTCTLVENHCPVERAAESCSGLCASELRLFQRVLGPGVAVQRTEHLMDQSRRCTYVIRAVPGPTAV